MANFLLIRTTEDWSVIWGVSIAYGALFAEGKPLGFWYRNTLPLVPPSAWRNKYTRSPCQVRQGTGWLTRTNQNMETPLIEAIVSHYLEQYPHLIRRGNILFFQREGTILSLEPDEAVLATGITDLELQDMVARVLLTTPTENLEKINQIRGWKYLFKRVKWHRIDYGDPLLFQLTDTALHLYHQRSPSEV